jgi:anion-transporting  ArsA/GET3 family ATPase
VGKSVVAMALAKNFAEQGRRTLFVELGQPAYFGLVYGFRARYQPQLISSNLFHAVWTGEECLREYVQHLVKIPKIADLFFDNRVMRAFVRAAPGLKELAILGKLTSGIRESGPSLPYDDIVFDAYATGHFLALLRAPLGMGSIISKGPMGTESRRIIETLQDSQYTKVYAVTLPEDLPVVEVVELKSEIEKILNVVPKVLCNRVYGLSKPGPESDSGFAKFLSDVWYRQSASLEKLAAAGPFVQLPMIMKASARDVIQGLQAEVSKT